MRLLAALPLAAIEKLLSAAALVTLAGLSWLFLYRSELAMRSMRGDGLLMDLMWLMMEPAAVGPYLFATSVMWIVMMLAMMSPAVLPMMMVYRGLIKTHRAQASAFFASGYFIAWAAFSLIAALLQWQLHQHGQLGGPLLRLSPEWSAAIFIGCGIYQLTPLKAACLARCQSPIGFFMRYWHDGSFGALRMGLHHGIFCIGCCWVLMLLMFAGGAMSVIAMAVLAAFILLERVVPGGVWAARVPGILMLLWGAAQLVLSA